MGNQHDDRRMDALGSVASRAPLHRFVAALAVVVLGGCGGKERRPAGATDYDVAYARAGARDIAEKALAALRAGRACASATPVPATVPNRSKVPYEVQPSGAAGEDFNAGDERGGWKCTGFALFASVECQFSYVRGTGFKSVARGGPDPGPDGFEGAVECDFKGDGKTTLYAVTGSGVGQNAKLNAPFESLGTY